MLVNIIMFFTMYPVLLVLYFCFRGQYQYADGCLFAVNMKPEWIKEPEVAAIVEKFRREMKQYFIFLLIVPLSSFLTKHMSIQLTIWMMWILIAIVLLCLPLVHANSGLKRWKTEHCLYETEKMEHRIELKAVGKIRRVKFLPFFLPNLAALLLALVPVWAKSFNPALEKTIELSSVGWLTIVMWLCGVALTAVAVWMDRQPAAVINNDSDVNLNYTRARKNIWKNCFDKTLKVLQTLNDKKIKAVLSTSCSLLHVPYTLKHEHKISQEYLAYFAFAEEKLGELKELSILADAADYTKEAAYKENQKLFAEERDCKNADVKKRLSEVKGNDYVRLPERSTRQKLQKKVLGLPEFPTTTIGSFPQTKDVKANRQAYRKGEISEQEYIDFNRKKIAECVALQEEIGLDVLVHGEYERNDMVEYFGEALGGFLFTEKAWVQSYGTRCVKPPVIWGDVYRKNPITVAWSVYAQSLTKKPMKGMLTGPVTILNWSFPREDISIRESIAQIALAIRDEVLDLEAKGIQVIQIDEAALREKLPLRKSDWYTEYLDFAISAFRLTHSGVKPETQIHTHMCYSEFTDIIAAIDDMDADVITFEASRSDLQILDSLRENHFETEVGPGVYDIHSPRVPSVEEIVNALHIMLTKIEKDKLWVNPDCGLKTRGTKETEASLRNMVEAAKEIRKQA